MKLAVNNEGKPLPVVEGSAVIESARELYRSGASPKGDSTGWIGLDEFYTVAPSQMTVVTGMPGSGKSEWLDAMMINLLRTKQWEFAVYSPENWPVHEHLIKLTEKVVGKPFYPGPTERMTEEEYDKAALAITRSLSWVEPVFKTPKDLILSGWISRRHPDRKFGIILDPWNTLEHERGLMSETDYISFVLTEVIKLARMVRAHIWLVVHPAKMYRDKATGKRSVPTPYDIAGSAHWYNKADNIVTVHRDQVEQGQEVEIHVQKVRFKRYGRVGMTELRYDRVTGCYFEMPGTIYDSTGRPEQYRA